MAGSRRYWQYRLIGPACSVGAWLFIESGHQPLNDAKQKIVKSNCWAIIEEESNLFKCRPKERTLCFFVRRPSRVELL